jgi:hypothetical protein
MTPLLLLCSVILFGLVHRTRTIIGESSTCVTTWCKRLGTSRPQSHVHDLVLQHFIRSIRAFVAGPMFEAVVFKLSQHIANRIEGQLKGRAR